jgi:hypothetical protein
LDKLATKSYQPQVPMVALSPELHFITFEGLNPRQISPDDPTPSRPPEKGVSGLSWSTG